MVYRTSERVASAMAAEEADIVGVSLWLVKERVAMERARVKYWVDAAEQEEGRGK